MKRTTILVRTSHRTIVIEDVHEVELIPARGQRFLRETQCGYPDRMRVVWSKSRSRWARAKLQLVPLAGKTGDD